MMQASDMCPPRLIVMLAAASEFALYAPEVCLTDSERNRTLEAEHVLI